MEYRRKCKTCGKIWCYTDSDLSANARNNAMSGLAAIGGIAAALGGTAQQQHLNYDIMERNRSKVVNYSQCPNCNSLHTDLLSDAEWEEEQRKESFASVHISINANASTDALLKRTELFLEDGDWATANAYCDSILDAEPENPYAYLYKLMAELKVKKVEELKDLNVPFDDKSNYSKVLRFADEELAAEITGFVKEIKDRIENQRLQKIYDEAKAVMDAADTEEKYLLAARQFSQCSTYKDTANLILTCTEKAEESRIREEEERKKEEALRAAQAKEKAIEAEKQRKKTKRFLMVFAVVIAIVIAACAVYKIFIEPEKKYESAVDLLNGGDYYTALELLESLGDYKDSGDRVIECKYHIALDNMENEDFAQAKAILMEIKGYEDTETLIKTCDEAIDMQNTYDAAIELLGEGSLSEALDKFEKVDAEYKDTGNWISIIKDILPYEGKYKFVSDRSVAIADIHFALNEKQQVIVKLRPGFYAVNDSFLYDDEYYDASDSWVPSVDVLLYNRDDKQYYFEAKYCGAERVWEFKKDKVELYADFQPDDETFHETGIKQ